MSDPVSYRHKEEEERWKRRDPIVLFRRELLQSGAATEQRIGEIEASVEQEINEAVSFADQSPNPSVQSMFDDVYRE
jgi:pyruvate dehydrogenase E1 component alpha subunit